jgi:NAD(P)H dehydrogenase (quinone)
MSIIIQPVRACAAIILLLAVVAGGCTAAESATANERIIVSGASGQLGTLVVEELLALGVEPERLILVSRTPEALEEYAVLGASTRFGDYTEPESLAAAYEGGDRLLLISINTVGNPNPSAASERVRWQGEAIRAAAEAGVGHIVYTSFVDAEVNPSPIAVDHRATEALLRESDVAWTSLRNQLYMDGVLGAATRIAASGQAVVAPNRTGISRAAHISRQDIAAATAVVLTTDGHENRVYEITGAEIVGPREVAVYLGEITGSPVEIIEEADGDIDENASFLTRTTTAEELLGRRPTTVREFLEANRDMLVEASREGSAGTE